MYSLIVSAKLNGIDPLAYLRHVLTNIADYPINKVGDLLPWNVAGNYGRCQFDSALSTRRICQ